MNIPGEENLEKLRLLADKLSTVEVQLAKSLEDQEIYRELLVMVAKDLNKNIENVSNSQTELDIVLARMKTNQERLEQLLEGFENVSG